MRIKCLLVLASLFIILNSLFTASTYAQTEVKSSPVTTIVGNPSLPSSTPGKESGSVGDFVYYCQGNTSWANSCGLGVAGCGPTSLAMIISTFGLNMPPPEVDKVFRDSGWRACGDNPSFLTTAINSKWLSDLGFEVGPSLVSGGFKTALAKQFIDNGYLIIASSTAFPCANCKSPSSKINHIFVISDVDISAGTVDIRDANNCSYTDGNDENQSKRIKSISSFPWYYAYPIKKVR